MNKIMDKKNWLKRLDIILIAIGIIFYFYYNIPLRVLVIIMSMWMIGYTLLQKTMKLTFKIVMIIFALATAINPWQLEYFFNIPLGIFFIILGVYKIVSHFKSIKTPKGQMLIFNTIALIVIAILLAVYPFRAILLPCSFFGMMALIMGVLLLMEEKLLLKEINND